MERKKFLKLLEKQAKGQTSAEEDQLIFNLFDKAQEDPIEPFVNLDEELSRRSKIFEAINKEIGVEDKVGAKKSFFIPFLKYAAVLALFAAAALYLFKGIEDSASPQLISKSTNQEQKAVVTLTDGTKAYLNVLSEIRFPETFDGDTREVEVKGEVFFEVSPDTKRPFIVRSSGLNTQVLGTSFNVNAYNGDDVVVAVKTGSVKVSSESDQSVVLVPNQKATFKRAENALAVEDIDIDYYLDWRNRTITFNLDNLDDVFSRLARVYNMEIELLGYDGTCSIKASFPNNNLYSVLYGLENLVDFDYVWKGEKKLQVIYKGCKN